MTNMMDVAVETDSQQSSLKSDSNTLTGASTKDSQQLEEKDDSHPCPLFMDGLSNSNFASNPHLAALASLLDSNEEEINVEEVDQTKEKEPHSLQGSPVSLRTRRQKSREKRRHEPYKNKTKKKTSRQQDTTTGEMMLFVKMWKL